MHNASIALSKKCMFEGVFKALCLSSVVAFGSFSSHVLENKESSFYQDYTSYKRADRTRLPIGIFDSGTGGLTVMSAIVKLDEFNNVTGDRGGDGIPDFQTEFFQYLADQANMPYGLYGSENNASLLKEHIVKDAHFLLGNTYYVTPQSEKYAVDKLPVKTLVIACNTATAYGKQDIETFIKKADLDTKVIGVIDAGVEAALEQLGEDEDATIAIFATVGTVASEGYVKTLKSLIQPLGKKGEISVVQQPGLGMAECIDGVKDYICSESDSANRKYRGPSMASAEEYRIKKDLLKVYNFEDQGLVKKGDNVELNSVKNYVRYHVVSLVEKVKAKKDAPPLQSIILGCTHYPYIAEEIESTLNYLRDYQEDGVFVYRPYLKEKVELIDPAFNTALELYVTLREDALFNSHGAIDNSSFFISVPNEANSNVESVDGAFTYQYKYGRKAGEIQEYTKRVPFKNGNIEESRLDELTKALPEIGKLIKRDFERY